MFMKDVSRKKRNKIDSSELYKYCNDVNKELKETSTRLENLDKFILSIKKKCFAKESFICGINTVRYSNKTHWIIFTFHVNNGFEGQNNFTLNGFIDIPPTDPEKIYEATIKIYFPSSQQETIRKMEIIDNYIEKEKWRCLNIGTEGLNVIKDIARAYYCHCIFGDRIPRVDTREEHIKLWGFYDKNGFTQWEDKNYIEFDMANYKPK